MELRQILEKAYQNYHREHHREQDPIQFAHRYQDPRDREIVAFLSALISYGNVKSIIDNVEKLLSQLGSKPYQCVIEKKWPRIQFTHRFTTAEDIEVLLYRISKILKKDESLEAVFGGTGDLKVRLTYFVETLESVSLPREFEKIRTERKRNLKYLVSNPNEGSACKRLNMFLRWVVRPDDGIDLGLWKSVSPSSLILPLDTHLLRVVQKLGWTKSKNATWKVAEAATLKLREIDPIDPIKYDFSLCHLSMSGDSL